MTTMVPLANASDKAQSIAFAQQRLVNLYPETSQFGGKSPFTLIGTPGLKPYATAGDGPHRGAIKMVHSGYFVSGAKLFRVTSDGTVTQLGSAIIDGQGLVSMATAGDQVAIATSESNGFIYDDSTGLLTKITSANFFGGQAVTALDGYFIWCSNGTFLNRFQISALLDGLTYDALDFASAETTGTELIRPFLVGTQVFMYKPDRTEIWYNSGNVDFPFERLNSTVISKGIGAKFSPALLDNTVYWVGLDDDGGGSPVVYRADGYTPTVISTHVVSKALGQVADLNSIQGISYTKDNHSYYGIILPQGNAWFFDRVTGVWHERHTYGLQRWLGNIHLEIFGKTLIGSFTDGAIYELDLDTYFDATTIPIVRDAILPTFGTDPNLKRCSRLRLDMETGMGLSTGQGSAPLVKLNISDDRGKTWSGDLTQDIGVMGDYGLGVEWRQLGQFRSRVHRLRISDPIKVAFVALYADIV